MGRIVVSENITLDGVVQDPTGEEGFERGGWFGRLGEADRQEWARVEADEAQEAAALLLGRRSYEWFAARWPARRGAWADRLNGLPKYVVSATLEAPRWSNSHVLTGDVVVAVTALKQRVDGVIVVYASGRLVRTLMEHDLVDELRLMTFPFVLGAGERLFGGTGGRACLRLTGARTVGDGLALLGYETVRAAR